MEAECCISVLFCDGLDQVFHFPAVLCHISFWRFFPREYAERLEKFGVLAFFLACFCWERFSSFHPVTYLFHNLIKFHFLGKNVLTKFLCYFHEFKRIISTCL
jgi:hypothetical protein